MVKKFKDFIYEGRLGDISNIEGSGDLYNNIKKQQNKSFVNDSILVEYIILNVKDTEKF